MNTYYWSFNSVSSCWTSALYSSATCAPFNLRWTGGEYNSEACTTPGSCASDPYASSSSRFDLYAAVIAALLRHRIVLTLKFIIRTKATTPSTTPSPILAFTLVDRLSFKAVGLVFIPEGVDKVDAGVVVAIFPNLSAMVYRGVELPSSQHEVFPPQYHVVEIFGAQAITGTIALSLDFYQSYQLTMLYLG